MSATPPAGDVRNCAMKWLRKRLLDLLLIVALVTVATQRAMRNVPEIFPGGAAIGEILATLATGYTGAWLFNLIHLRLPKSRDMVDDGLHGLLAEPGNEALGGFGGDAAPLPGGAHHPGDLGDRLVVGGTGSGPGGAD